MIVETKRLRLRRITVEDAEFILRLVNEPSFVLNIGDKGVKNLHDAERFILEDNLASINLLKKLGMDFEKTVKMSDDDPGTVLYS